MVGSLDRRGGKRSRSAEADYEESTSQRWVLRQSFANTPVTARTGQERQLAQVKPADLQLADEPPEVREPVRTFTEPNLRSALPEPQSGHWGERPSE